MIYFCIALYCADAVPLMPVTHQILFKKRKDYFAQRSRRGPHWVAGPSKRVNGILLQTAGPVDFLGKSPKPAAGTILPVTARIDLRDAAIPP
jgi:hypothetical protein